MLSSIQGWFLTSGMKVFVYSLTPGPFSAGSSVHSVSGKRPLLLSSAALFITYKHFQSSLNPGGTS